MDGTKKRKTVSKQAKAGVKSARNTIRKVLAMVDPEATKTVTPVEVKF